MLFFKRILNFSKAEVAQREKRRALRYPVEAATPLRAVLRLRAYEVSVRLLNLSSGGAAVEADRPLNFKPGDSFQLRIELGKHALRLKGIVAHQLTETARTVLGLSFDFANLEDEKNYLQMLEPVAIGASLKPVRASTVHVKEGGLTCSEYEGVNHSLLIVSRKFTGQDLQGFEFRLADHVVRNSSTPGVLEISAGEEPKPGAKRGTDATAEIRQLFLWVVPQLSSKVPDDVRAYLAEFHR